MTAVIFSLFTLGAIDALDPYDMTATLLLLQMVRKDWHVLIKIWTSYITYWVTAVGIYYGFTEFLLQYVGDFIRTYPVEIGILQMFTAFLSLAAAVVLTFRLIRNWSASSEDISKVIFIKSVHPVFIVGFAIFSVWSNIPVLWPLYSFITVLVTAKASFAAVVVLLGVFTLFCYMPQLFIYLLYKHLEAEKFNRIMSKTKRVLSRIMLIVIPLFLFLVSIWALTEGLHNMAK